MIPAVSLAQQKSHRSQLNSAQNSQNPNNNKANVGFGDFSSQGLAVMFGVPFAAAFIIGLRFLVTNWHKILMFLGEKLSHK